MSQGSIDRGPRRMYCTKRSIFSPGESGLGLKGRLGLGSGSRVVLMIRANEKGGLIKRVGLG